MPSCVKIAMTWTRCFETETSLQSDKVNRHHAADYERCVVKEKDCEHTRPLIGRRRPTRKPATAPTGLTNKLGFTTLPDESTGKLA